MNYIPVLEQCPDRNLSSHLERAIANLFAEDAYLLSVNCSERAIAFRLAHYMQILLIDWNVDAEYNRMGDGPKKVAWKDEPDLVLPDVIVHKRGALGPNKLAIEIKKDSNPEPKGDDLAKLLAYRTDRDFLYENALFIRFGTGQNARSVIECEWV